MRVEKGRKGERETDNNGIARDAIKDIFCFVFFLLFH